MFVPPIVKPAPLRADESAALSANTIILSLILIAV
jgi:hypothetical protein